VGTSDAVLDSRTITLRERAAVARRTRISGSKTYVSLNPRLESNTEEEEEDEKEFNYKSGLNCVLFLFFRRSKRLDLEGRGAAAHRAAHTHFVPRNESLRPGIPS
jgi:hypothetical protein